MLIFCHGKESGPIGSKSQGLIDAGLDVMCPDFRGLDFKGRVSKLKGILESLDSTAVLIGSSMGGATALVAAHEVSGAVEKIVLCAPALKDDWWPPAKRASIPCVVLHGTEDDIIPLEWSVQFCETSKMELITLEGSDHRLATEGDIAKIIEAITS